MSIEKFDREKAQRHLDSHPDAVVEMIQSPSLLLQTPHRSIALNTCWPYSNTTGMRLCYLTDMPPQTAEQPSWREQWSDRLEDMATALPDSISNEPNPYWKNRTELPTVDKQTGQVKLPKGAFEVTAPLRPFGASGTDPIIQDILHRLGQAESRLTALEQSKNGEK